ncbi:MAG: hypothetical protein K2R98_00470 [Gemmataceae bacterium]|nr:hypothetical protein [Gemmataceae bacterium]
MVEHFGAVLLRLAGVMEIASCRAAPPEVVLPRQLPDGLLEVHFTGQSDPDWFLVEIATDPGRRASEQAMRDAMSFWLARRVLPEVVTLVLRPKGTYQIPRTVAFESRLNFTRLELRWRVIELWTLSAEQLVAAQEVGLVPWVPLARFDGPAEPILQQCRALIDQKTTGDLHANLLAVMQVMLRINFTDDRLFALFGDRQVMIESPLILELVAQNKQESILEFLDARFGSVPPDVETALKGVVDLEQLSRLNRFAALCNSLEIFRLQLTSLNQ